MWLAQFLLYTEKLKSAFLLNSAQVVAIVEPAPVELLCQRE